MKNLLKHICALAAVALLVFSSTPAAQAQQYGYTTLTNNTGTAISWSSGAGNQSNWAASVTATKYDSFDLVLLLGTAGTAGGGTMDIRWSTSPDGVNWVTGLAAPGASGWFGAPCTNSAAGVHVWRTNITMNSIGYWRIDWATNVTGNTLTNFNIRAYTKPKRTG